MNRTTSLSSSPLEDLRTELFNAYVSAKAPGWYAGEGEPVRPETFEEAKRFLDAIPDSLWPTEIFPEPDGDIAFEWYSTQRRIVVVSFDGQGRAVYVVRFSDKDKASGQVPYVDRVPDVVLYFLRRFFSIENPA
jgi:hypothetical protein